MIGATPEIGEKELVFAAVIDLESTLMSPKHLKFLLAFHCHQPVGNYEHVFEDCFQKCYRPLVEALAAFPQLRFSLHYSGPLLGFIEKKHPENLELLRVMTARGQVEWIGGGFYEPILPTIPARDAVAQILKMRKWIADHFNFDTRGLWLTERVWEPGLPTILQESGVEFTMLDDTHFLSAGIHPRDMLGYYRTEDNGHAVDVFPIDWSLRKSIPFHSLDETFGYFWELKERAAGQSVTLGDDGEKFGVWPGTHKHVYEEKYLERFLDRLQKSSDWLKTAHFADIRAAQPPRGMIYMPTASYPEMMEWALPYDARVTYEELAKEIKGRSDHERFERFMRGAHWRNFFAKYPESNLMHKKMLYLSDKLNQSKRSVSKGLKNGVARAYDALWQGQCNCAYWHGLFGGLYLRHLREGIYRQLLGAELELKRLTKDGGTVAIERMDFDCDGREEILVSGPVMNLYIQPHYGGSAFEFDVLPRRANLLNVLTRRPEPYHLHIRAAEKSREDTFGSIHDLNRVKEKGLEKKIVHDWHLKRLFLDHLIAPDVTLERFARADSGEYGDFVNQPYRVLETSNPPTGGARIRMEREGGIYRDGVLSPVTICKTYHIQRESGRVEYEVVAPEPFPGTVRMVFGIELNFIPPEAISKGQHLLINHDVQLGLADQKEVRDVESLILIDGPGKMKLIFGAAERFHLWTFPVETVSQSESGLERTYQGTSALLWRPLELRAEQKHKITLEFRLALA